MDFFILAAAGDELTDSPATTTTEGTSAPGAQETGEGQDVKTKPEGNGLILMFIMLAVLMFFVLTNSRSTKKRAKAHETMIESLKKNDRVRTAGGIYGTVADVRSNQVVLKIDENNNVKMKFSTSAIVEVISDKLD